MRAADEVRRCVCLCECVSLLHEIRMRDAVCRVREPVECVLRYAVSSHECVCCRVCRIAGCASKFANNIINPDTPHMYIRHRSPVETRVIATSDRTARAGALSPLTLASTRSRNHVHSLATVIVWTPHLSSVNMGILPVPSSARSACSLGYARARALHAVSAFAPGKVRQSAVWMRLRARPIELGMRMYTSLMAKA